jgi:hypothetical protein
VQPTPKKENNANKRKNMEEIQPPKQTEPAKRHHRRHSSPHRPTEARPRSRSPPKPSASSSVSTSRSSYHPDGFKRLEQELFLTKTELEYYKRKSETLPEIEGLRNVVRNGQKEKAGSRDQIHQNEIQKDIDEATHAIRTYEGEMGFLELALKAVHNIYRYKEKMEQSKDSGKLKKYKEIIGDCEEEIKQHRKAIEDLYHDADDE